MSETEGVIIPALGRHGEALVAPRVEPGNGLRLATHNFCDPCTWWQESTEVVAGACTDSGDLLTYTVDGLSAGWVIDVRHARLTFEDDLNAATATPMGVTMDNLIPTVLQDGVAIDQALEDHTTDLDRYTIAYSSLEGTPSVVFGVARGGAVVVTLSYRKAAGSGFTFRPQTGRRWVFEDADVDHTADLDMVGTFSTEVYGSKTDAPPDGTAGTIALLGSKPYKKVRDFHAMARTFRGPLPANLGLTGGVGVEAWTWVWQFLRADEFYSTANYRDQNGDPAEYTWNYLRCVLSGDVPYGGTYMTLTYYGQESAEGE